MAGVATSQETAGSYLRLAQTTPVSPITKGITMTETSTPPDEHPARPAGTATAIASTEATEATEATEPPEATESAAGNAEAAAFRRRLRAAETERDGLTATLDVYRRRDVEAAAEAAGLARGGDLFDAGAQLGDLLAADGTVDLERVAAATATVLTDRPHWRAQVRRLEPDHSQGVATESANKSSLWADVLRGGKR